MADIAIVTETRYEAPQDVDWYVGNILEEERILGEALARQGLSSARVGWCNPDVDWSSFRAAVVRSTWDYFVRFDAFTAWLDRVVTRTRLFNAPETIRWNTDKHYLLELAAAGLPAVPTEVVERGEARALAQVMEARGWPDVVIKPAVSGAGRHTYRVTTATVGEHEARFAELVAAEAMLVQPFAAGIVARGEVTVVCIDGEPTHALLKRARPGEFRVQDDHGGTVHPHEPAPDELELTRRAFAACSPAPLYGRLDMVRDDDGALAIMELELVEPELWFRRQPAAADRLAAAIARELGPR